MVIVTAIAIPVSIECLLPVSVPGDSLIAGFEAEVEAEFEAEVEAIVRAEVEEDIVGDTLKV